MGGGAGGGGGRGSRDGRGGERTEPELLAVLEVDTVEPSVLCDGVDMGEEALQVLQRAEHVAARRVVALTPRLQLVYFGSAAARGLRNKQ